MLLPTIDSEMDVTAVVEHIWITCLRNGTHAPAQLIKPKVLVTGTERFHLESARIAADVAQQSGVNTDTLSHRP